MDNTEMAPPSVHPDGEKRLAFDEHVRQLPDSKQKAHRWLIGLVVVAFVLLLGVSVYALYASFNWKSVGEENVVIAWLLFLLAWGAVALVLGIDTVVLGASVPPPFEGSKHSYETGPGAVRSGWTMIGLGALVVLLCLVAVAAVRAGRFGLEDWITLVVGFWVVLGLAAAALAVLRRLPRSR